MENHQQPRVDEVGSTEMPATHAAQQSPTTPATASIGHNTENDASVSGASTFGQNVSTNFPPPPKRTNVAASSAQSHSSQPPASETRINAPQAGAGTGSHAGPGLIHKAKGLAAQTHGLGESLRGNVNAAVDTAFNDEHGQQKNEAVADKGTREVLNKDFDHNSTLRR